MRISLSQFRLGAATAGALFAAVACGEDVTVPPATIPNVVDTVTLWAVTGTPVSQPSAFDMVANRVANTTLQEPLDFVFDMSTSGASVFEPALLVGLINEAGLLPSELPFDSIITAPEVDYISEEPLPVQLGSTFVGQSRLSSTNCSVGSLPRYGKFHVLEIDTDARTVTLELLVNENCAYRSLEPGIPET
jgi:hypothetical protein